MSRPIAMDRDRAEALIALALARARGAAALLLPGVVSSNGKKLVHGNANAAAGDWQFLQPIDGVSDDWPRLMAALAQGPVVMLPGPAGQRWQALTTVDLPTNCLLVGTPQTIIENRQVGGIPSFSAVFRRAIDIGVFATTVAAPGGKVGTSVVPMNAAPAVGSLVYVGFGATNAQGSGVYRVVSVAGGGPFQVTLDRPILTSLGYTAGSTVVGLNTRAEGIRIVGNGMRILQAVGTSDRIVEIVAGFRSYVGGLRIDGQGNAMQGSFLCSFDVGGFECMYDDVEIDNFAAPAETGIIFEASQACVMRNCRASRINFAGPTAGLAMNDCIDCIIADDCESWGCSVGVSVNVDNQIGCLDCYVGGAHYSHRLTGVLLASAVDTTVSALAEYNGDTGIHVLDAGVGVPCAGTRIVRSRALSNRNFGIRSDAAGSILVMDVDVTGNGSNPALPPAPAAVVAGVYGASGSGPILIDGIVSRDGNNNGVDVGAAIYAANGVLGGVGSYIEVDNYDLSGSANGFLAINGGDFPVGGNKATLKVGKGRVRQNGPNQIAVIAFQDASADVLELTLDGTLGLFASGVEAFGTPGHGSVARVGPNCDLDASGVPVSAAGAGVVNTGQFNAALGVFTYTYPARKTETVILRNTSSGGSGVPPQVVRNAGVSFVFTPGPGDTSLWEFWIR
jgi:hypothetical protein